MFDDLRDLFQIDWRIFMAAAETWLRGGNPYGQLSAEFSAGAFAYPPTALPWLLLFVPLGALGFYFWTALQLAGWWLLIRKDLRAQLVLVCWSPLILGFVEGQSTLAVVLVLWAVFRAERRGWLAGMALAWALTKPQVAIIPTLWLLWQARADPERARLWGGLLLGTLLLALPPTLINSGIWGAWLTSLGSYRGRILQMAAWQGPSVVLVALAAYLWYRFRNDGWHWWLAAALFPQASFYSIVALLPTLRPRQNPWMLGGLALAGILQGPVNRLTLPWLLAGHLLAAWMIAGGTVRRTETTLRSAAAPRPQRTKP